MFAFGFLALTDCSSKDNYPGCGFGFSMDFGIYATRDGANERLSRHCPLVHVERDFLGMMEAP